MMKFQPMRRHATAINYASVMYPPVVFIFL